MMLMATAVASLAMSSLVSMAAGDQDGAVNLQVSGQESHGHKSRTGWRQQPAPPPARGTELEIVL